MSIAAATVDRSDQEAIQFERFDLSDKSKHVRIGTNYLVVQALNYAADCDDFLFDAKLTMTTVRTEKSTSISEYTEPIAVEKNTQLTFRGFNVDTQQWTSAFCGDYIVDIPDLTITEIQYHPVAPTSGEHELDPSLVSDNFEFVEVKNTGNSSAYLSGIQLDGGISYRFGDIGSGSRHLWRCRQ